MTGRIAPVALLLLLSLLLTPGLAQAQSIIKQPGNHADYSVELEPHFAFQWSNRLGDDDGFGPGLRVNIPFLKNGPISSINNNMAIGFGADVTFGDAGPWCRGFDPEFDGDGCNVTEVWLPVVLQWNFFLTKVISVFGEPGFAIAHRRWDFSYNCNGPMNPACDWDESDTDVEFVFGAGARFMFSDRVGATVRLGWPMLTAGINFLL